MKNRIFILIISSFAISCAHKECSILMIENNTRNIHDVRIEFVSGLQNKDTTIHLEPNRGPIKIFNIENKIIESLDVTILNKGISYNSKSIRNDSCCYLFVSIADSDSILFDSKSNEFMFYDTLRIQISKYSKNTIFQ